MTAGVAVHALTHPGALRRGPVKAVLHKQIYFTGIQGVLPVSIAAVAIGLVMESQMRNLLGSGIGLNVKMLKLVVLREIAPLFTAIIVLGRSGAAMATEMASMKVQGEVRSLYLMGINPGDYLITPRVIGCCIAVPVLTFYFQVLAAGLGTALASVFVEMELGPYYTAILNSLGFFEVMMSLSKSVLFGLIIASVACSTGIYVPPSRTWIPQAAELAVLRGFVLLLLADVLFALLML